MVVTRKSVILSGISIVLALLLVFIVSIFNPLKNSFAATPESVFIGDPQLLTAEQFKVICRWS